MTSRVESTATPWGGFAKRKKNTRNLQNGGGNHIKSEVNCDVKHIRVTASRRRDPGEGWKTGLVVRMLAFGFRELGGSVRGL